jgi:hypothetical protein
MDQIEKETGGESRSIQVAPGLSISHGEDGYWMHFYGNNKQGSINLGCASKSKICVQAMVEWAEKILEEAE